MLLVPPQGTPLAPGVQAQPQAPPLQAPPLQAPPLQAPPLQPPPGQQVLLQQFGFFFQQHWQPDSITLATNRLAQTNTGLMTMMVPLRRRLIEDADATNAERGPLPLRLIV